MWLNLANAYNQQRNIYISKKDIDKSIKYYQKALELAPKNKEAWKGLAEIFEYKKSYYKAIDCYEKVRNNDKIFECYQKIVKKSFGRDANAWNGLGDCYFSMNQFDKAIESFENAVKGDPQISNAWNKLGKIYHKKNKFYSAIECFEKAISANNNHALEYEDQLIECYDNILSDNPEDIETWVSKGNYFRHNAKFKEANICFEKALEIDPNNQLARHYWASLTKKTIKDDDESE